VRKFFRYFLLFLLGCLLVCAPPLSQPAIVGAAGPRVQVWLTTRDGSERLAAQPNLAFSPDIGNVEIISVNENQKLQQMDGFGAAVTDSSAWLMHTKMSVSQRNALMQRLFDPRSGIGISFVRIPMGASDFSANGPYSYDDLPPGQIDPALNNFSINHDLPYIIPALRQARAFNPALTFMANPWSPPAWMKTNGSMLGIANGQTGTLIGTDYEPLARYFVKFIQAYQAEGIPIYAITPQNEPLYTPATYPGMYLDAIDEDIFVQKYLDPALAEAGLHPKIIPYDYNWDHPEYAYTLLSDATTNHEIAGISWHCYAGNPSAMTEVHNAYPTHEIFETECATGSHITRFSTIDLLMQSVQNYARTVELWNIALNPDDGPHTGGCSDCPGLVTVDEATGNVTYPDSYYQLGQFSKFVVPGAYHIASNTLGSLADVAFKNPDGSKVVVAHKGGTNSATFQVLWNGKSFAYTLPVGATVTFKWQSIAASS
jgi:glucosylceramidase